MPAPAAASARAASSTTTDPDLHLLVDGRRIDAAMQGRAAVFHLALPSGDLRLMSRGSRPHDLRINQDQRMLGFCLRSLAVVQGGARRVLPLDHPDLHDGLHQMEETGRRWTNGAARLPASLFAPAAGMVELHVEGFGLPHYRADRNPDAALFARFESLGDDCEFGLVQRGFDAEPMGLLRWASTDAARLVLGLCRRFDGLGDPAQTKLEYHGDPAEYKLRDPRYLRLHTWATERLGDAAREEEMRLAGAARLRLLRRKLLADIEAGRQIFVFKTTRAIPNPDSFVALHAALRGVGKAPLLCVMLAARPEQVGTVEDMGDGLYIGHMDQFSRTEISFTTWRRICAATAAMVDAAGGGA